MRSSGLFTIPSQSQAPSLSECPQIELCQQHAGFQNKESKKAPHASARNNLENTYGTKFNKYYDERNCYMTKKFNNLNLVNDKTQKCECAVHSKKCKKVVENLRKLEENYWAQWKPVKAESENALCKANTDVTLNLKQQDAPMPQKAASVLPYVKVPIITNYVQCKTCLKFIEKDKMKINNCGHCKCSDAAQTVKSPECVSEVSCRNRIINEGDEKCTEILEKNYCSSGSVENKSKSKKKRDNENNTQKINKENKSVRDDDCVECHKRRQNANILYLSTRNTHEIPEKDKPELSITELCPPRCNILLTSGEDSLSSADGQSMGNDSGNIIKTAVQDMTEYIVTRFTEHINPAYKSNGSPRSRDTSPENNPPFRSEQSAKKNSTPMSTRSQVEDRKISDIQNLRSRKPSKKYSDSMSPIRRSQTEDKNAFYQNNEVQLKENLDNIKFTRNLINQAPTDERSPAVYNNKQVPENYTRNRQHSTMMPVNGNVQPSTIIYQNVDKQLAAMISPRASMQTATRTSPNSNLQTTTMGAPNAYRPPTANTSPRVMQATTRTTPNANIQSTTMAPLNANAQSIANASPRAHMQPTAKFYPNANMQSSTIPSTNVGKQQTANMQPAYPIENIQPTTMVPSDDDKQQAGVTTPNENIQPAIILPPNSEETVTVIYPNPDTTYMDQTNQAQYPSPIMQPSPSVPVAVATEHSQHSSGISNKSSGRSSFLKGHSYPLKAHKVNLLRPAITSAKYKFKQ